MSCLYPDIARQIELTGGGYAGGPATLVFK